MLTNEYIKMNGRIYEVIGKDGRGLPICSLTDLKEIPEDKPLEKPEEDKWAMPEENEQTPPPIEPAAPMPPQFDPMHPNQTV